MLFSKRDISVNIFMSGNRDLPVSHMHISIEYRHLEIAPLIKLKLHLSNAIVVSYLMAWGSGKGYGKFKSHYWC